MDERKRPVRSQLIAARARLTPEDREARSRAIAERIAKVPGFLEARILAVYAPIGTEVNVTEIAREAVSRGVRLAYPRLIHGNRKLAYARALPDGLVQGPRGTLEPPSDAPIVELADIDCALVPGVGFSVDGHRMGRGGGHYDATLARMPRALRIGVAFEVQLLEDLPREPHDAPVHAVVTEARTLLFPGAPKGPPEGSP